jgi:large repetitive protein
MRSNLLPIALLAIMAMGLDFPGQISRAEAMDGDMCSPERIHRIHVRIAVIDSGISEESEVLMSSVWVNPNEIPDNGIDDDNNGCIDDVRGCNIFNSTNQVSDDYGHGSFVIAALVGKSGSSKLMGSRVSSEIKVIPIRALTATTLHFMENGRLIGSFKDTMMVAGTAHTVTLAINYAIAVRERTGDNIIINASWTFNRVVNDYVDLEKALKKADASGILIVFSAGNEGNLSPLSYPASLKFPNMISVGAIDGDGFANYSSVGADIAADGTNTPSANMGELSGEKSVKGTSFAAPLVALTAAEVWERNPGLTAIQVKERILETADALDSLKGKVNGGRKLNFEKAIAR